MKRPSKFDIQSMRIAQEFATVEFWAYPDREWQVRFQADWLVQHGFPPSVKFRGLTYGETAAPLK
jgi:hypothetical protein